MPLPLVPIAVVALRYGAVALVSYTVARSIHRGRTDQRAEDAMDDTPEGITIHPLRDADQLNVTARLRRVFRLHPTGPGVEMDATTLTRLRFRKV